MTDENWLECGGHVQEKKRSKLSETFLKGKRSKLRAIQRKRLEGLSKRTKLIDKPFTVHLQVVTKSSNSMFQTTYLIEFGNNEK